MVQRPPLPLPGGGNILHRLDVSLGLVALGSSHGRLESLLLSELFLRLLTPKLVPSPGEGDLDSSMGTMSLGPEGFFGDLDC